MRQACTTLLAALFLVALPVLVVDGSQEHVIADVAAPAPRAVPTPVAARPGTPSGRPMPRGDLRGWRQTLAEDFTGRRLPGGWGSYAGQPGGNRHGWWDPARVAVRQHRLLLTGGWHDGRFTTGGVMAWGARSTYGKYEIRFRVQRAAGVSYALLLWPANGRWPAAGEIDLAEDGGGDRRGTTATLHHGAANRLVQRRLQVDVSRWQTLGVEWTAGQLVYTLNGRSWSSLVTSRVPTGPMDLALQLEAGRGDSWAPPPGARTPARVALEVDWAVAYQQT